MYESPIKIIESTIDSIYKDIAKKKDDAIFAKIQSSFGVDVDRQELMRALQYDRNQYDKGYADGKRDAVNHGWWVEDYETFVDANGYESEPVQTGYVCSECGNDGYPNWHYCPNCGARMDGDGNG